MSEHTCKNVNNTQLPWSEHTGRVEYYVIINLIGLCSCLVLDKRVWGEEEADVTIVHYSSGIPS